MLKITRVLLATIVAAACSVPTNNITEDKEVTSTTQREIQLRAEGEMPSLDGATGWLNSKPITRNELRGKVVLVDIWTYTCINWLRTEPYVRAWADKYKANGLVVIGVHSPEFEFEK